MNIDAELKRARARLHQRIDLRADLQRRGISRRTGELLIDLTLSMGEFQAATREASRAVREFARAWGAIRGA